MIQLALDSLLGLVALVAVISMIRFHRSGKFTNFNLLDLVTTPEGIVSRPAVMELGAWVIGSWSIILAAHKGPVSEALLGVYLGFFVARAAHSAYLAKDKPANGNGNGQT